MSKLTVTNGSLNLSVTAKYGARADSRNIAEALGIKHRSMMQLIDKHQQAIEVSTHSRPKAAGGFGKCNARKHRRFNSQPPEGGWAMPPLRGMGLIRVSTHSRPKAAGSVPFSVPTSDAQFQLTAARRRLARLMIKGSL